MTDEQAKNPGLRALAHGMPWVDGLMDGGSPIDHNGDKRRVGCLYVEHVSYEYGHTVADWHDKPGRQSWPDFRDPLTEAWLVAWVLAKIPGALEEQMVGESGMFWLVWLDDGDGNRGTTRAEAWLTALDALGVQS